MIEEFILKHWGDCLNVAGSLLSFIGLIFTISARRYSKQAQSAAEAAKDASEATKAELAGKNLVHALGEIRRLCSEMNTLLTTKSHLSALIRARDMGDSLTYVLKRWELALGPTLEDLQKAHLQMQPLIDKLNESSSRPLSDKELKRIRVITERIQMAVIGAQAIADKKGS